MPRLSIVIPCLGGAAEFDGTLVSVLQNRPDDCEVLVVHTSAYDDPYGIGEEVEFLHSRSQSLAELINEGIERASGELVHIVGCGLEVTESWADAAVTHFDDPEVAAVTPLVLGADRQSIVSAGLRWSLGGARKIVNDRRLLGQGTGRLRANILGPTLSAAFYRREVLLALDGLDMHAGDELADVELALAIHSLGRLHVCEPGSRLIRLANHSPPITRGFKAGRAAEHLFWQHATSRGFALSAGMHALTVAADSAAQSGVGSLTSLVGRGAALFDFASRRRFEQRLATAADRLAELAELKATLRLPGQRLQNGQTASPRRQAA